MSIVPVPSADGCAKKRKVERVAERTRTLELPGRAHFLREAIGQAGDLAPIEKYLVKPPPPPPKHTLKDFEKGTVFEMGKLCKKEEEEEGVPCGVFTTYKGDPKSGWKRISGKLILTETHYALFTSVKLPCIAIKGEPGQLLIVDDESIIDIGWGQDGDGLVTCMYCGNKWDGYAQCYCGSDKVLFVSEDDAEDD